MVQQEVSIIEILRYRCDLCLKYYDNSNSAIQCEQKHIKEEDKHYDNYKRKFGFELLKIASEVEGQKKLK